MTQINPSLYIKPYGSVDRSDGWYVERSTNDLVAFVNGAEVSRIASGGAETITLAEGYIFVGNASGVAAAFDAKTRGQLLAGNGTTVAALDAKSAGRFVMGDGTDVISQAISGDVATVSSNGKVSLNENFRLRSATSETTAGNTNYTLAKIKGGLVLRDPSGADRTDTTDSASALVAGLNNPAAAGQFFDVVVVNTADADETITLAAGAGVTLSPATIKIGRGQSARLLFRVDNAGSGTEAITCYLLDNRLASGQLIVGDSSGMPIPKTMSGVITGSVSGANFVTAAGTGYDAVKKATVHLTADGTGGAGAIVGTAAGSLGHASGVTIVAAPGSGNIIVPVAGVCSYKYSGAAYGGGASLNVDLLPATGGYPFVFGNLGITVASKQYNSASALFEIQDFNNQPLVASVSAEYTQPGAAAGTIDITVWYYVLAL